MNPKTRDNALNVSELCGVWIAFLGWCHFTRMLPWAGSVLLTPVASLLFLQSVASVVHEAAHGNFIQGNARANEFLGNWLAAFVFCYDLEAFRRLHFEHHAREMFLISEDAETATALCEGNLFVGFFEDLFLITAFRMFVYRLRAKGATKRAIPIARLAFHGTYALAFLALIAWTGTPLTALLFALTLPTLYASCNRIRTWAVHGDLKTSDGLRRSGVARNVHSPFWERFFFGNRRFMYHYDHHLAPHLPFRDCEKAAQARASTDVNVAAPGYFFCLFQFLRSQKFRTRLP